MLGMRGGVAKGLGAKYINVTGEKMDIYTVNRVKETEAKDGITPLVVHGERTAAG